MPKLVSVSVLVATGGAAAQLRTAEGHTSAVWI